MTLPALFSIGFIMGLTGAMAPGPLLTVTISESAKRGGIVGPLMVLGHGILELALLLSIVFGLGKLLHNPVLFALISFGGGLVLIWMGVDTMRGLNAYTLAAEVQPGKKSMHPVVAGVLISISNPYWFIWWLTIGMGYVMFAKSQGAPGIMAFFLGHISSDLVWYSFVSYGIQMGGKYFNTRVLKTVLFVCSLFLVLFGIYFLLNGFRFL
jgi:threonine/homoserine/homoserine lactone efflux protein